MEALTVLKKVGIVSSLPLTVEMQFIYLLMSINLLIIKIH